MFDKDATIEKACKEIIEQLPAEMESLGIQSLSEIIGGAHS